MKFDEYPYDAGIHQVKKLCLSTRDSQYVVITG